MRVEQILRNKGTRIISVRPREPVAAAAKIMASENIGALVVTDVVPTEGTTVVGMFSERDVLRALVDKGQEILRMPVERLMSRRLISCSPNDDLADVMEKMERHGIRHVPVLEGHTLVGVVSIRDVIGVLRSLLPAREVAAPAA